MVRNLRLWIVFLICASAFPWSEAKADAVMEMWSARFNGPANGWDYASAIAVDSAGNVFVTGSSSNTSWSYDEDFDYVTIKYDGATGAQLWVARYDGPAHDQDRARALAVDGAGNVFVTGWSKGTTTGYDYATVKYDGATGNQLWVARYSGAGNGEDMGSALALDSSGNVFVTGASWDPASQTDYATVKYDGASGSQLWVARYNGPANGRDRARAVAVDSAGNVLVTGWSEVTSMNNGDFATVKYDGATGNQLWVARYNGPANWDDSVRALALDAAGNAFVTGESRTPGPDGAYDYVTIKYDGVTGNQAWIATYNSGENSRGRPSSLAVDSSGDVIVTGDNYRVLEFLDGGSTVVSNPDYITIKYSGADGHEVWRRTYNGPTSTWDTAYAVVADGRNVFVTGSTWEWENEADYATLKYDGSGNQLWVARYSGPGVSLDGPSALVASGGCVYVTGGSSWDYATIKYCTRPSVTRPHFPGRRDFIPYCFDFPDRWPNPAGLPIPFAGPACPPSPVCPECSFAAGWDPGKTPPQLIAIYSEILKLFSPGGTAQSIPKATQQVAALLQKAPSGPHYTDRMKASASAELGRVKTGRILPPQAKATITKALNALELDWRLPQLSPAEFKSGKHSAADFQGVAWVTMSDVRTPGKAALRLEPELPAAATGFSTTWPIASYAFDFSGELAKGGYMDVTFHTAGIRFEGPPSTLRILQWDGKTYNDITTYVDSKRGMITGRTTRLSTFVLVTR